jgi:two-component system CheB/CheR fusion protein
MARGESGREGREFYVNILVRPVPNSAAGTSFALMIFDEVDEALVHEGCESPAPEANEIMRRLEEESQRMRDQLQGTVEEYATTVEEHKAANEELRSTTEELETSKEELQSVNEELCSINLELKNKVDEITNANDDLKKSDVLDRHRHGLSRPLLTNQTLHAARSRTLQTDPDRHRSRAR